MDSQENLYYTPDLNLASFLKARGATLTNWTLREGRLWFVLDKPGIEEDVRDFFNDGAVPIQAFVQAQRFMRAFVRNQGGPRQ